MCGCHINAGPEIGVASTKVQFCAKVTQTNFDEIPAFL